MYIQRKKIAVATFERLFRNNPLIIIVSAKQKGMLKAFVALRKYPLPVL